MSNTYENAAGLYPLLYETIIRRALEEDLGRAGDITTDNVVPAATRARALIVARKSGRIAGLEVSLSAFHMLDADLDIRVEQGDGNDADAGRVLAVVEGAARPILSAERTALNMLGRLCGIATVTADAVAKVNSETTRVICTRKTTPGLRVLEKYAVRMGGGTNHRFGLDDGVLLKDNHIVAAGGIGPALARIRERLGHMVKVEVEVDTLDQLDELLSIGADAVLLDNMDADMLQLAVKQVDGRLVTEASGGITPDNIEEIAATGVDLISLGWLTHSAKSLDVALDLELL